ncbi:related to GYP8 - GTPase-activating protein [Ustilago trichophora]|uniref:Related to GYP8 - GTPase-activating protein n=1 Tax=Ustilago trichophora TaxID=86804 RepID=A0A5C3EF65_9BASI|nr:related to GYP8 - GTPase-activating protein [Ustilago trichophora]
MAESSSAAESSTSAAKVIPSANGAAELRTSSHRLSSNQIKHRRRELQQQCLQPSGLDHHAASQTRVAAWLFLLGISQDHVLKHARTLSQNSPHTEQSDSPSTSSIVQDSLSSPIPIDEDGWQVASDHILETRPSQSTRKNGTHAPKESADDQWKLVKSKKSKRRIHADTASTASQPESPDLGKSTQSSTMVSGESSATTTPAMSPRLDESPTLSKDEALGITNGSQDRSSEPLTDQERYPNLLSRDIEQVAKDVERSFVGPAFKHLAVSKARTSVDDEDASTISDEKAFRRRQLSHLVLTTLSRHPSLSYFQGYHDILSVVLLTLAPSDRPASSVTQLYSDDIQQSRVELTAERISLHLIRDSMTRDLLPVMGQLKILGQLIRLSDSTLADLVDRASPLPFFALPWLLTLLTHDATDVAVMQRVLELVLAFGPAAAIYLCAAVLLARKDEILAMDTDELEDPAMLHSSLGRLPAIRADSEEESEGKAQTTQGASEADPVKEKGDASHESNAIYTDPDVELPSLASDRALAASSVSSSSSGTTNAKKSKKGIPISSLLSQAVQLMEQFPMTTDAMQADKIMGPNSVLFTWPHTFDLYPASSSDVSEPSSTERTLDWSIANARAESILTGPTESIVLDPHPPPPTPPASDTSVEKHSTSDPFRHEKRSSKKQRFDVSTQQARMLAVVGLSGLLVAAIFTASQNPSSAVKVTVGTEETKRVLALVVSLLTNWGRVVGN